MRGPIPDKPVDRPRVPDVIALARAYYAKPGNRVGGNLHIVLDDGNMEDQHIEWCRQLAQNAGDVDGVALADKLLALTRTQRRKIRSAELYPTR